ncbi:MAG: hypothetical protein J7647_32765 [Cyanobacteria bacterium SBLK]|nr:hypothetical protein [Cyanobacteria bacterium SBLK]
MTPEQFEQMMTAHRETYRVMRDMNHNLVALINQNAVAPDLKRPIQQFKTFNWSSIGAIVIESDEDGVAIVRWGGKEYKRRSPSNRYDPAIWFSRRQGSEWERLITFNNKVEPVEPIGEKARRLIN